MITLSWLLLIALAGGALALVDGIVRVRGRGTAVLAVIEIVVAALFLLGQLDILASIPLGATVIAAALLVILVLQLLLRGGARRSRAPITVIAIVLVAAWIVLSQGWLVIPGVN